jgi:hypothetical protein
VGVAAIDGAMTKAPISGAGTGANPTDRGKKGTKKSILTYAKGISISVVVDGANRHDKMLVKKTLVSSPGEFHPQALSEPDLRLSPHTAPIIQPRKALF